MITLSNDFLEVKVHEQSGTVTELIDKLTGVNHLLSRLPELELLKPGMGILEAEPRRLPYRAAEVNPSGVVLTSIDGSVVKRITLKGPWITIDVKASGAARIRELLHLSCGHGGYWGEALGAMYNCRYFVKFGFEEGPESFSSVGLKPPVSGFAFSKHTYQDRYFPELSWASFIDSSRRVGIAVVCLGDCYGVVEDQFFNVELNLVSKSGQLSFMLAPFNGLARVDYVDEDLAIGIEAPDVVVPGSPIEGKVAIYPFRDLGSVALAGLVRLSKNMPILGRRGYDVDRVRPEERLIGLGLESNSVYLKAYKPASISFRTDRLDWDMDFTLYALPIIELNVGGRLVRRVFSINPDYGMAIEFLKRKIPKISLESGWNPHIESFYDDKQASLELYELASEDFEEAVRIVKASSLNDLALNILKGYVEGGVKVYPAIFLDFKSIMKEGYLTSAASDLAVKGALAYRFLKADPGNIIGLLSRIADAYVKGDLIHWFNGLHGGAGSAGLFNLILAYDLLEDVLPEELKLRLMLMFRWAQGELIKITNAWAGNWELTEALALLAISTKFRFKNSKLGLVKAEAVFRNALNYFLDDGAWVELSAGYHNAVLNLIVMASELLRLNGVDIYGEAKGSRPILRSAVYWLWQVMDPNYRMPALEDSGDSLPNPDPFLILGVRYNDPGLVKVGLRLIELGSRPTLPITPIVVNELADAKAIGGVGEPARGRVTILDASGRFVVRGANGLYLILDYGPHGGWHGHPDKLSFELHYGGVPIVVDAGVGGYYNPIHWTWHRRSIAHNTVTLGTEDQAEARGKLISVEEAGDLIKAVFEAETYNGIKHRRTIIDVADLAIAVVDNIEGRGRFRWNIHCMGDVEYVDKVGVHMKVGGIEYTVAVPKIPEVSIGWRMDKEAKYIYYEDDLSGAGIMWGVVSFTDFDITGSVLRVKGPGKTIEVKLY